MLRLSVRQKFYLSAVLFFCLMLVATVLFSVGLRRAEFFGNFIEFNQKRIVAAVSLRSHIDEVMDGKDLRVAKAGIAEELKKLYKTQSEQMNLVSDNPSENIDSDSDSKSIDSEMTDVRNQIGKISALTSELLEKKANGSQRDLDKLHAESDDVLNDMLVDTIQDVERGNTTLREFYRKLKWTSWALVIISLGLIGFLSWRVIHPSLRMLNLLLDGVSEAANGNFSRKIPESSKDEFGSLAQAFNNMSEQISVQQIVLNEQSKMASLGTLAAGVAHEINNPLAIVMGRIEQAQFMLLNPNMEQIQMADKLLGQATKNCFRIENIVSGLKKFARNKPDDPLEQHLVRQIIADSLALVSERISHESARIQMRQDLMELAVSCRASELIQVVVNLLTNALDAMATMPMDQKWIQINVESLPSRIKISITDSGVGIPVDIQKRVMEPFFTTKVVGKGTGLGLSISQGIISTHGGSLTLDTDSMHTRFVILLPQA